MSQNELSATYSPQDIEDKWYKEWLAQNLFKAKKGNKKQAFSIIMPPPNVTGKLHMGHALDQTCQDVLTRFKRMQGYETLWIPGTDHAGIATQAVVERNLYQRERKTKNDIGREEFLKLIWKWKEDHGDEIVRQLKKLGVSCDWDYNTFTMDEIPNQAVRKAFVDLYNKGKIYRGVRMINWDPEAKTAVSDEEVIYREVNSKLYHVRYQIEGEDGYVNIATTRPETILGDTAVCINPNDNRYKKLKNKKVLVPLINRTVPIIEDEYVDMEVGTGCLKITPAHDLNDYELGIKHNLDVVDIFNDDGTLNEKAQLYIGKDRFEVRKLITADLDKEGHLVKTEDYTNKVGYSERTDAAIEPKLSMQWFLKMKELGLKNTYKF